MKKSKTVKKRASKGKTNTKKVKKVSKAKKKKKKKKTSVSKVTKVARGKQKTGSVSTSKKVKKVKKRPGKALTKKERKKGQAVVKKVVKRAHGVPDKEKEEQADKVAKRIDRHMSTLLPPRVYKRLHERLEKIDLFTAENLRWVMRGLRLKRYGIDLVKLQRYCKRYSARTRKNNTIKKLTSEKKVEHIVSLRDEASQTLSHVQPEQFQKVGYLMLLAKMSQMLWEDCGEMSLDSLTKISRILAEQRRVNPKPPDPIWEKGFDKDDLRDIAKKVYGVNLRV